MRPTALRARLAIGFTTVGISSRRDRFWHQFGCRQGARRLRLLAGDVAAQEDPEGGRERNRDVDRRDPERADDDSPAERRLEEAVPGVELGGEEVTLDPLHVDEAADRLLEELVDERSDDRRGAVPRQRGQEDPAGRDPEQRHEEDSERRESEGERVGGGDLLERDIRDRLEAPGNRPRDEGGDEQRREQRARVRERREHLPGQDLAALERARQDQLERAARVLGSDDVSGDERGQELRAEAGGEREDDEREHDSRVTEVERERCIVWPALLEREHDDEEDRQQRRRAETDVRALLRGELAQLPAVGGERRRPHATAFSGAAPSVSSKKRSSSAARSGTRAG